MLLAILLSTLQAPGFVVKESNDLYLELTEKGVQIGDKKITLPAPTLTDGMTAKEQTAQLQKLAGIDYTLDDLQRDSVVASHVYKCRSVENGDPKHPAYVLDCWFVFHAEDSKVAKIEHPQFLAAGSDRKQHVLSSKEVQERKLKTLADPKLKERWEHLEYALLDKIQIRATNRTVMTRGADWILVARKIDNSFQGDKKYPNEWQRIKENEEGRLVPNGEPSPYESAGMYLKITRLKEPNGAWLAEFHQVALEPKEWFGDANPLRSKLQLLVQSEVRSFRREMKK